MSADDLTTVPRQLPMPRPAAGCRRWPSSGIAVAVVVACWSSAAWAYGRSSTAPDRAAADAMRLRAMLLESRTQVLDAQLSLHSANFGNAAQHLEYAKPPLAAASSALRDDDQDDLATKVGRRAAAGDDGPRPRRQAQPRRQQQGRRGLEAARRSPFGPAALIALLQDRRRHLDGVVAAGLAVGRLGHDDRLAAVEDDARGPRASRCRSSAAVRLPPSGL